MTYLRANAFVKRTGEPSWCACGSTFQTSSRQWRAGNVKHLVWLQGGLWKEKGSGAKTIYGESLHEAPKFALQEGLSLLQLSFFVLQPLQPPVLAELSADESEVEIAVSVAQPTALAQQGPIEGQDSLSGPRCHEGRGARAGDLGRSDDVRDPSQLFTLRGTDPSRPGPTHHRPQPGKGSLAASLTVYRG